MFYTKWTQNILPFQSQLEFTEVNAWCYNVTDSLAHLSYYSETIKSWQLFYNASTQLKRCNYRFHDHSSSSSNLEPGSFSLALEVGREKPPPKPGKSALGTRLLLLHPLHQNLLQEAKLCRHLHQIVFPKKQKGNELLWDKPLSKSKTYKRVQKGSLTKKPYSLFHFSIHQISG